MSLKVRISALLILLALPTVMFVGCKTPDSELQSKSAPEIQTEAVLSSITEEEYQKIGTGSKPEEGVSINDLKKLSVSVKIIHSKNAVKREIRIPDLTLIDRYDRVRSTSAGSFEQNNIGTDDTAESAAWIIFDSRGMSEQDIREIFKQSEIYAGYRIENHDMIENKISIGESFVAI
jgi:hypothetical protein